MKSYLSRIVTAFAAGWLTYVLANSIGGGYWDGWPVEANALGGLVATVIFVVPGVIVRLILRGMGLEPSGNKMMWLAFAFVTSGFIALVFAQPLGLTHQWIDPDDNSPLQIMFLPLAILAYAAVVTPIVNWPVASQPYLGGALPASH